MTNISKDAQNLLQQKRYFQDNEKTWDNICLRVSKNIASAEKDIALQQKYQKIFYNMMSNMIFIPSTPTLLNAGTKVQQLSSCFIVSIDDNIESIMNTVAECSKIFQKSGGAGFNISKLRPKGSPLKNSGGQAGGVVSFMRIFDRVVEEIKHGNSRKGALKIDLDDNHPDIFEFIQSKDNTNELNNMNISVSISDKFMESVINDSDWELVFEGKVYKKIKARELWNKIISNAWKTGEPGLSFRDTMNRGNPNPHLGEIKSTNPCSEFVNIPYSSCNLGSINLLKFVENEIFNWNKFKQYIHYSVRFLDNMISVNKLPLSKIQEVTEQIRPIGLGTMGLADAMFALKISMNSRQGLDFIDQLYSFLYQEALEETKKLAEEKGLYPAWKGSKWEEKNIKVRNSSLISIAPNGSIAFLAGVNGGIEPIFSLVYTRRTAENDEYFVVNPILEKELRELELYDNKILEKIINNNGSIRGIKGVPKKLQNYFVTAMDMSPEEHINCLEVISKYVDLSVSKTINLPKYSSIEDVANVYLKAWETGVIKGVTVYRDGSREDQILSVRKKEDKLERGEIKSAPEESANSKTIKLYSGCGSLWVTLTKDKDGNIDQTFVNRGSQGTCVANQIAVSRLISLALRGGIQVKDIVDQLLSIPTCPSYYGKRQKGEKVSKGSSCPSAIGIVLDRYFKEKEGNNEIKKDIGSNLCPDCGEELIMTSSCVSCVFCGFSKCD